MAVTSPDRAGPRVEMIEVHKTFGGVHAVQDASLELHAGSVLGLLGHNGAGKSTLVRLLSGAERIDSGEIRVDGRPVTLRSTRDARAHGIEMVYQNLALADNLDATANLFLGRELRGRGGLLDLPAMERAARDVIGRINPRFQRFQSPVASLSGGERQSIAIARAVHFDARVLILDEPTAALGPAETQSVAAQIRALCRAGLAIVLVSHDLHDVFALSDRVVVMRAGRVVATHATSDITEADLLGLILGAQSATT